MLQRSASSPGGASGSRLLDRHAPIDGGRSRDGESLDFSTVERDQLPVGVSTMVASRMRLDAAGAPSMLELRMNYRNLLNEMNLHGGKVVSHQYALMKPRRKVVWEKPRELEVPAGMDPALFRRVAKRRAMQKVQQEEGARNPAPHAHSHKRGSLKDGSRQVPPGVKPHKQQDQAPAHGTQDEEDEGAFAPAARDPTAALEVQELLNDQRVRSVHQSMQDPPNSGFLPQSRVPRALEALGYISPDPALVKTAINSLVRFESAAPEVSAAAGGLRLAVDEFCAVLFAFSHQRQEQLREAFRSLDRDDSGSISIREFRHLLWDLGFTVPEATVEEIFAEVDQDKSGMVELSEFEAALKILHDRHGFTRAEAAELFAIFDRYDLDGSGELSAGELASALGWFGTPTTISQAQEIIKRFDTDVDGSLCRCEFLMVMRSRLEEEISEIRALFAEFDVECKGTMNAKQLAQIFQRLGYTIPHEVIAESIKELGPASTIMGLVFEDVCKLLSTIRKRHGFAKSEMKELLDVYHTFDKLGRGEMREFELAHALNWLGYPLSHQRRRKLWCAVDMDKTNSIDEGEFLKLVRLLREEETAAARKVLELAAGQGVPREKDLKEMLHQLGYSPGGAVFNQAIKRSTDTTGDGTGDILGVLSLIRFLREGQAQSLRHSAGLPDTMTAKIKGKFNLRLEAGKRIDAAEFERFMYELFKSARASPGEREKIKNLIRDHCTDGGLLLAEMFWVVRLYGDMLEETKVEHERRQSMHLGFSEPQVAQFRHAFVEADKNGTGELTEQETMTVFNEVMSLSAQQITHLKLMLQQMGEGKDNIDFSEFLRLMGIIVRLPHEGI